MKIVTLYACEICEREYRDAASALECERRGFEPSVKVGDVVTARSGFGWCDGDEGWISNPDALKKAKNTHGNCFGPCCTWSFFYVVTHVDHDAREPHRPRYHLATLAMSPKQQNFHCGWTYDHGHYAPTLVENPPAHVLATKGLLLNERATWLL